MGCAYIKLRNVATDHQLHHTAMIDFIPHQVARILTIAKDRHSICEFLYLAEAMGNINHTHTTAAQTLHYFHHPLGFML